MSDWKKVFGIIWTGQLFSTLSSAVVGYAVVFWLSMKTGSSEVLAFATIAALLPQLMLGIFSGVMIDRWDRKITMIIADIFIAVCTAVMALLFFLGEVKISYIYFLLAMRSVGAAFHVPAMQASVPLLAPESELMRISGINQVIQSVSTIGGPALAALLLSAFDMTYVLMFDVAGAAIACGSLLMVHIPNPKKKEIHHTPDILREMKEGLHEIYRRKGLLWLFIFIVLAFIFIMPVSVLFPLLTVKYFAGGTYHMSVIEVAWGIGMLFGGAVLGIPKLKLNKVILINTTYVVIGLTFAIPGMLSPSGFWFFAAITLVGGIAASLNFGAFNVILQTTIDPAVLGRVFSIYGSVTLLPSMIGLLQTGLIADRIGITNVFIISGIAIAIIGIVSFFVPPIKHMIRVGDEK